MTGHVRITASGRSVALVALCALAASAALVVVARHATRGGAPDIDMFAAEPVPDRPSKLAIDLSELPVITCDVTPSEPPPRDDVQVGTVFIPFSKLTEALERR
jgi:hypothetical protein